MRNAVYSNPTRVLYIYVCLRFLSRFTTCTYSPHAPSLRHNRNESVWYNSMRVNKSVCIVYVCKQEVIYVQCSITFGYAKYIQTQCYVLYTLFVTGMKKKGNSLEFCAKLDELFTIHRRNRFLIKWKLNVLRTNNLNNC